jgi:hypothetical protein
VAVLELQSVRGLLTDWNPPPVKLGFRVVREEKSPAAPWWKGGALPAWAQAAAAVLIFAAGMAVSQVDVRYADGALTLRPRSIADRPETAPGSGTASAAPAVPAAARTDIALPAGTSENPAFTRIEEQLRNDLNGRADANDILRRVRGMIEQSEAKQQRELALRLADVVRDFDTQRRADLVQVQQNFGQLEGQTGEAVARNRELLNYLVRTSGR